MIFGSEPPDEEIRGRRTPAERKAQKKIDKLAKILESKDTIDNCVRIAKKISQIYPNYVEFDYLPNEKLIISSHDIEAEGVKIENWGIRSLRPIPINIIRQDLKVCVEMHDETVLKLSPVENMEDRAYFIEIYNSGLTNRTNLEYPRIGPSFVLTYKPGKWENILRQIANCDLVGKAKDYSRKKETQKLTKIVGERFGIVDRQFIHTSTPQQA